MKLERPTYNTSPGGGTFPVFVSSVVFNGQSYIGDPAKSKKEAERMAARAVIESILGMHNLFYGYKPFSRTSY